MKKRVFKGFSALHIILLTVALLTLFAVFSASDLYLPEHTVGTFLPNSAGSGFLFDKMIVRTVNATVDYGVDNSGMSITNDTLQKALNSAKSRKNTMTKIVIPKGLYLISQPLIVYSNTWIYCEKGAVIKRCQPTGPMLKSFPANKGGFSGCENIIIEGGTWNGNAHTFQNEEGFSNMRFAHSKNLLFRNLTMTDNCNGHYIEIGGSKNCKVQNCTFTGYSGTAAKEAIQLDIMHNDKMFGGFEPFDDTPCRKVLIENCTFDKVSRGIGSHSAVIGIYYTDIVIKNNRFDGLSHTAVLMYNYRNVTVGNNIISDCTGGIEIRNMAKNPDKIYYLPNGISAEKALENVNSNCNAVVADNQIALKNPNKKSIVVEGFNVTSNDVVPAYNYEIKNVRVRNNSMN